MDNLIQKIQSEIDNLWTTESDKFKLPNPPSHGFDDRIWGLNRAIEIIKEEQNNVK